MTRAQWGRFFAAGAEALFFAACLWSLAFCALWCVVSLIGGQS